QAGTYRVVVTGINSADDYLRLAAGLREVPVVRTVTPLHASAGQLELSVEMTTGLAGGTGTRAFMIGAADWHVCPQRGEGLRIRQLLMATMAAEDAML
ncbi:hypothetical protein, partial [Mesorhizobium sp. M8A.F.Ca.ET.207.01.1.1]|uniref:hypothetical protein n=1 Tax=Mesorhizobium sp. M8A.F.Ca.ET.207.01.1.1 TaxID=2563968 RepID=UPI001AEDDD63